MPIGQVRGLKRPASS
ncbi:SAG family member [Eimeria necatrix]|uniref:SAG family member n=1 Tax=Eimeria necatrix TaxID=51315 RepID=U6ME00_9EIME|nr:SAG family member [Eimeria necatrix]CDJ62236.1 SAG family member [Eimeria necatrix]